jgi:hypothetical protein
MVMIVRGELGHAKGALLYACKKSVQCLTVIQDAGLVTFVIACLLEYQGRITGKVQKSGFFAKRPF